MQTVTIVDYTRKEEFYNTLTHAFGAAASFFVFVACMVGAVRIGSPLRTVCAVVFGLSMMIMYTASTVYHGVRPGKVKKICRVIDHCMVFLAIAGCATPSAALLYDYEPTVAIIMWVTAWGSFTAGILMAIINFEKTKPFRLAFTLIAGLTLSLSGLPAMIEHFPVGTVISVFGGGAAYIIGMVLYAMGKKVRYCHSIFHVFVLLGSAFHAFGIWYYIYSASAL
ncbi:MAG: hemolysin III family protein [Clostridia bacterium]|nr:hemolysin III family protein [Clostridia bacterium]